MKNHVNRTSKKIPTKKSVGVRELKTYAAHIMRQVRQSRTSYVVTHRGRAIGVILPVDGEDDAAQASEVVDATAAWKAFLQAGRRLERRFAPGSSGVRLLSGMRR